MPPAVSTPSSAGAPSSPLFDEEAVRKLILALARCTAASLASGIALSTGEPQSIASTLRIQREIYNAFTSLAYRDPSLPPLTELGLEEPVTKVLSALNRFGAAAIAAGVIGSSRKRHSIGDAMRTYYEVVKTMWPPEATAADLHPEHEPPASPPASHPAPGQPR